MYYRARFYHPALGRFISADTIVPEPGQPQDFNRYSYVQNNPLRYIDPSGHRICEGLDCEEPEVPAGWPPSLSTPTPDTSVAEALVGGMPDAYDLLEGGYNIVRGGIMINGGFYLAEGGTYAGQTLVYGTYAAKNAAGNFGLFGNPIGPSFTHAGAGHAALAGYMNVGEAVVGAVGHWTVAVGLGVVYGVDVYQYQWGSRRDVGLNSSEFAAAIIVDTVFQLGPPALGTAIGFAFFGPGGAVIGGGLGSIASAGLSFFARDAAIGLVDEYITGPIWNAESSYSGRYPENIPSCHRRTRRCHGTCSR
jgi:hypothetical protein